MLAEGFQLTLVGMATVFGFLSLLVGLMVLSARVLESHPEQAALEPATAAGAGNDEEIAVVLASIEAHRRRAGH